MDKPKNKLQIQLRKRHIHMPKQQNTSIPKTIHHKQHNTKSILHKTMQKTAQTKKNAQKTTTTE